MPKLSRIYYIVVYLVIGATCLGIGMVISPTISLKAQSSSVLNDRVNSQTLVLAGQERDIVFITREIDKHSEQLERIENDVSLIRGVGIGLGSILMVLQVIQSLVKAKN